METSGITKLVVSAKGEGGLKVVLKPKRSEKKTIFLNKSTFIANMGLYEDRNIAGVVTARRNKAEGKRKALIIAVSDYDNLSAERQLSFCRNDGEEIYNILTKLGYKIDDDCKLIGRAEGISIRRIITEFFRRRADPKDTLIFYFSGHGFPGGLGNHYLASSDIDPDYPETAGYAFEALEGIAKLSPAKKIVTILDCCFSGAAEIMKGGGEDEIATKATVAMRKTFQEGDGKCVLASSLTNQSSYKMKGKDFSVFTYYLVEGLRGGDSSEPDLINSLGEITPQTLGTYVYNKVLAADKRQKPIIKTAISGTFPLAEYPLRAKNSREKFLMLLKSEKIMEFNRIRKEGHYAKIEFNKVNLDGLILDKVDFRNLDLVAAEFKNAKLRGAIFTDSDLRSAHFEGADLSSANFRKANLRSAHFWRATLIRADFRGAKFHHADDSKWPIEFKDRGAIV